MSGDQPLPGGEPVPEEADEAVFWETPDIYGAYPRLTEDQIARLAEHGQRRSMAPNDVLIQEGSAARRSSSSSAVPSPSSRTTALPRNTCCAYTAPVASSAN